VAEIENIAEMLNAHVLDHVDCGCRNMNHSLGIQQMPEGYALMLNVDETHFYWLRYDGLESYIHWDKWAIYRGAKAHDKWAIYRGAKAHKEQSTGRE
jgi:hypothetical protein